jgi:hypothetical protein
VTDAPAFERAVFVSGWLIALCDLATSIAKNAPWYEAGSREIK